MDDLSQYVTPVEDQPKPTSGAEDLSQYGTPVPDPKIVAANNIVANAVVNPDQASRASILSKQLGIPQPTIEADIPTYETIATINAKNKIVDDHPKLQEF